MARGHASAEAPLTRSSTPTPHPRECGLEHGPLAFGEPQLHGPGLTEPDTHLGLRAPGTEHVPREGLGLCFQTIFISFLRTPQTSAF